MLELFFPAWKLMLYRPDEELPIICRADSPAAAHGNQRCTASDLEEYTYVRIHIDTSMIFAFIGQKFVFTSQKYVQLSCSILNFQHMPCCIYMYCQLTPAEATGQPAVLQVASGTAVLEFFLFLYFFENVIQCSQVVDPMLKHIHG